MNDIKKKKKAREQKRKKALRIVFAVSAIVIAGVVIAGVTSCNNANKNKNPEVQVVTTEAPSGTDAPKGSKELDKDFYKASCFLGGQFIADMMDYELVDGADYQAQLECTAAEALEEDKENNIKPLVDELNNNAVYKKVFISFGDSELGMNDTTDFEAAYKSVIKKIKKYQPDAKLYILGLTPVTEEKSGENKGGVTNKNIVKMNTVLKEIAEDTNSVYCDLYKAMVNSSDALPKSYSEDGVTLDREAYEKCLVYIQKNYGSSSTDKPQDSEDEESTSSSSGSASSGSTSSGSTSSGSTSGTKSSTSSGSTSGTKSSASSGSTSGSSTGRKSSTSGSAGSTSGTKSSGSSSTKSSGSSSSASGGTSGSTSSSTSSTKSGSSSSNSSSSGSSGSSSQKAVEKDFESGATQSSGEAAQKSFE